MKHFLWLIAFVAALLTLASAKVDGKSTAEIGSEAPDFEVSDSEGALRLSDLKGKWVILSFWSAQDADSRIDQNNVSNYLRNHESSHEADDQNVAVVSVNFDRSKGLMKEVAAYDHLIGRQIHVGQPDLASDIRNAYGMTDQLRTFIINPQGEIVSVDPSPETLASLGS